ncbi:RUN [Halocaridina rubra]|uniref:RUN n=1 Tax=Halocaridina rubra TaxID=373956 RepID=A0AAN8WZ02_HALRR
MITESECRPVAIFDSNTKTPSYMESKTHGNRNYDSNNVENFADFETMNIEQKSHGLCEFQRRSSEMNFTMDRNEFRNALKVLGRTHSLDSNMKSDIMDLDSLLKGKETNNFEVVKSKVNDTSDIKELDSFEDEPVKSKCKGYEESDVEDRDFDRIVNRSFYESKLKQFRNYRDSIKEFDDECKHQESCSAVDYDLGGCTTGDEEWDSDGRPTGERWPPLGAPNDDEDNQSLYSYSEFSWNRTSNDKSCEEERLKQLEEEQEQLNNSLMALTSHFAQVQFRLKQIVDASPEEKENLLQELEEFANRGIPDLREATASRRDSEHDCNEDTVGMDRQKELIEKLKQQLEDLETYAYQTGEGGPPQSKVMEKQRVVIEQLKGKLNLNVDEFDKLTVDDLRTQVDHAIREIQTRLEKVRDYKPDGSSREFGEKKENEERKKIELCKMLQLGTVLKYWNFLDNKKLTGNLVVLKTTFILGLPLE